jgi:hypothetical protein
MVYLDVLPLLVPLQSIAFWSLLSAFTKAHNAKVIVSRYQSIDRHCMEMPVKFKGGLSMSVLRKKQLFTKKRGSKVLLKSHFFASHFFLSGIVDLPSNLIHIWMCFLSND